jgi:SAM-dependent methyltransferase
MSAPQGAETGTSKGQGPQASFTSVSHRGTSGKHLRPLAMRQRPPDSRQDRPKRGETTRHVGHGRKWTRPYVRDGDHGRGDADHGRGDADHGRGDGASHYRASGGSTHDAIVDNYDRAANRPCNSHLALRGLNNFIKATLITDALDAIKDLRKPRLLVDLGSGRGGDLNKWALHIKDNQIEEYSGCDIAAAAVNEAMARLSLKSDFVRRKMSYQVADALDTLDATRGASIVSGMLSANYLCHDTDALDRLLISAEKALQVGGVMILTFLDWDAVENVYESKVDIPFINHQSDGSYKYNLPGLVDNVPEFPLRMQQVRARAAHLTSFVPLEYGVNPELYAEWTARTDPASVQRMTAMLRDVPDRLDEETAMRFSLYAGILLRKMS